MSAKNYFTILEVSRMTGMPPYTIRYWESKFKLLRPLRLESGHRRFTKKDLEMINRLKDLILMKGYSLAGAKKTLYGRERAREWSEMAKSAGAADVPDKTVNRLLEEIKNELSEIIKEC
ncbi:MAG: MerR family transcriptional regulator [Elusimicrobia bacterium]|nr:MerR family transcriptional regulator [Elusimicrobiota bacterium]